VPSSISMKKHPATNSATRRSRGTDRITVGQATRNCKTVKYPTRVRPPAGPAG
jgi:hypothetical protein